MKPFSRIRYYFKKISLLWFFASAFSIMSKAQTPIPISGPVSGTWTSGNIYRITGTTTVPAGDTLTIQPGVEVIFTSYSSSRNLIVEGTLKAVGTMTDSIKFTGGGFTANGIIGSTVIEETSNNSILKYIKFSALGALNSSSSVYTVATYSSTCLIENCTISGTWGSGIYVGSQGAIVRNSFFTGNSGYDVTVGLSNLSNVTGNNPLKIGLNADAMTTNVTLINYNIRYSILGAITVPPDLTLTIQPGVEVIFTSSINPRQLTIQGTLTAVGTAADSIKFTSNGYTVNGVVGPIVIEATSSNSQMKYVKVNGLGYNNYSATTCALVLRSNTCVVENCNFVGTHGTAMAVESGAIIRNNFFSGNLSLDILLGLNNLPQLTGNSPLDIGLRGDAMTTNAVLTNNNTSYFILSTITVPSGLTLTVQPKVEIIFTPSVNPRQLTVLGTLDATGTLLDSIKFTGNGFSLNSVVGPVVIESSSINSKLKYVRINALGYFNNSESNFAVQIKTSACSVENCYILNCRGVGIAVSGNISPSIKNNSFYNTTSYSNGDILASAKSFANIYNNTNARIIITATTIDQNTALPYPGINSYYALSGSITVNQGYTLALSPNTIINFRNNTGNIVINGTLSAIGTETGIIQFKKITSAGNTALGGTLSFGTTSIGSILKYVLIDKLGNITAPAKGAALELNNTSVAIENLNVTNCATVGVKINNVSPAVIGSNFLNNATAVLSTGGQAIFSDCSFVGNTTIAISNTSALVSDTIDAKNCWWGAPSGPRHILNSSGMGDTIAAKVRFVPFKTAAVPSLVICPGGDTYLQIASAGAGYTYQWQIDNGTGFTNLANSSIYSGVTTATLTLSDAPSTLYGYRYRVIATLGGTSIVYAAQTIKFGVSWTGVYDTAWENAANWSCGVLPDDNTDVIVTGGSTNTPVLNSNQSCRRLDLKNNALVTIKAEYNLNVKGK